MLKQIDTTVVRLGPDEHGDGVGGSGSSDELVTRKHACARPVDMIAASAVRILDSGV